MAHFAKLDSSNKVMAVHVLDNQNTLDEEGNESEEVGIQFLTNLHGHAMWKQTSYNTHRGQHPNDKPLRKNYCGIGYDYDEERDAFIPPQSYPSWVLDEDTCVWKAPVAKPNDGKKYYWDEENTQWVEVEETLDESGGDNE